MKAENVLFVTHICLKTLLVIINRNHRRMLWIRDLILLQHSCRLMLLLRSDLSRNLWRTRRLIEVQRLRLDLIEHAYRSQQIAALGGPPAPMLWKTNIEGFLTQRCVDNGWLFESLPSE